MGQRNKKQMNHVKSLQIALVVVIVAAAILGGFQAYQLKQLRAQVYGFANSIGQAKDEQQARVVIGGFLNSSVGHTTLSRSAAAGKWWCLWLCGGGSSSSNGGAELDAWAEQQNRDSWGNLLQPDFECDPFEHGNCMNPL